MLDAAFTFTNKGSFSKARWHAGQHIIPLPTWQRRVRKCPALEQFYPLPCLPHSNGISCAWFPPSWPTFIFTFLFIIIFYYYYFPVDRSKSGQCFQMERYRNPIKINTYGHSPSLPTLSHIHKLFFLSLKK